MLMCIKYTDQQDPSNIQMFQEETDKEAIKPQVLTHEVQMAVLKSV